jgi:hypothetical protein
MDNIRNDTEVNRINSDNWRDELQPEQIRYVLKRVETRSDREAYQAERIPPSTFYGWDREKLENIVKELIANPKLAAIEVLKAGVQKAATIKVSGLDSRNERVRQDAATEILDRVVGKPTQPVTQSGEMNIKIVRVGFDTDKV